MPRDVFIIIGGHDLDQRHEVGRVTQSPLKIHVHPDWNPSVDSYDADLATLQLEHALNFNSFIQPICLWETFNDPGVKKGIVVGYGRNESQDLQKIPRKIEIPMQTQEQCFLSNPELAELSSKRTFCAGSADGSGVCVGDSGGGMFIKVNGVYYLRGIVSSSLLRDDDSCDVNNYAIFTNVLKFKTWIKFLRAEEIEEEEEIECGVMSSSSGLIQGGEFSSQREFPWLASIVDSFYNRANTSGALISHKHVVTRGNAVSFNSVYGNGFIAYPLSGMKIYFGVLRHDDDSAPASLVVNPKKILLHPDMQEIKDGFKNNVAMISLKKSVQFSEFIRAVCLWTFNDDLSFIRDIPIYAAGYGRDGDGKASNIKKHSRVKLVETSECNREYSNFNQLKGICIRPDGNGAPCINDETLYVKYNRKWYLRGIFSRQTVWEQLILRDVVNFGHNTCSFFHPFGFEDVAQFSDWIEKEVKAFLVTNSP